MSSCNNNAQSAFVDLATFAEPEAFFYGGECISWFVSAVQKSNWFSVVPLSVRHQGTFGFGQRNVSATLNRSGDYILNVWFRCRIPAVQLAAGVNTDARIRWTRNLMHNIFEKVSVMHNELVVHEFDNCWLDFNYQYQLPASKRIGYRNMIGDVAAMTQPVGPSVTLGTDGFFTVPLPFWFTADSGVALPMAALPYNEVRINYCFRTLAELLVLDLGTGGGTVPTLAGSVTANDGGAVDMRSPETYAEYVIVHNDERVKMGDAPRDIAMKQTQMVSRTPVNTALADQRFDLRLSHSIIQFFFAYRNTATAGEQSNYTTEPNYAGLDPISQSKLEYESTNRLDMGSDFYSLIQPYYHAPAIPDETGYHMWTYALHPWEAVKPSGSTNYSKLANVSITHTLSTAGVNAAAGTNAAGGTITRNTGAGTATLLQTFEHVFHAHNWNIVRIANGSLGHPLL